MSTPLPKSETSTGFVGKTAEFFLKNSKISWLLLTAIVVIGAFSFLAMPKQYNPEIVAPAFTVTADLPGANSQEVWELLTRRVEDATIEVPGVDEVSSQSIAGGRSVVVVKFLVGYSQDKAVTALDQKMRDITPSLPSGAGDLAIASLTPDDVPIVDIGLSSSVLSETALRKVAIDTADQLKRAVGVSKVTVHGGYESHLNIELDADSMLAKGVTLNDIQNAITSANGFFSIDTLSASDKNTIVSVSGNIRDVRDLERVVVKQSDDTLLRLGDIARVSYGPGDIKNFVRTSDRKTTVPTVHIALAKKKGENATVVSEHILTELEETKKRLIPNDVSVSVLRNEGETASEEIFKLTFDLIKSILIVGVLLALFLGLRNSLVASVSIPLVLLLVFTAGLFAEQTVNRITLFALILSLGLLVDDAIVVVENIARYFRLYPKENKIKIIVRAVDEVGGALALSTLTMALAFIPMAFVTGMMGPYMGPIPFFVPTALLISLVISITLNPFLAHVFAPKTDSTERPKKENIFSRLLTKTETLYAGALKTLLENKRKRRVVLIGVASALLIAMILPFTPLVPFRMLPKADKEQFYLTLDLPESANAQLTDAVSRDLERIVLTHPEVTHIESFVGTPAVIDFNGLFKGSSGRLGEYQATFKIDLTHPDERKETSEEIAVAVRASLLALVREHPNSTLRIVEDPPGPPVLATFLLKVQGGDDSVRETIAQELTQKMSQTEGIVDIDTTLPERGIDLVYRIDIEKAQALGISIPDAQMSLRTALSGSVVGLYRASGENTARKASEEYITIRFEKSDRTLASDLSQVKVRGTHGELVSLGAFTEAIDTSAQKVILSDNRQKTVFLSGEMEDRSVIYAVLELFPQMLDYRLPDGNGRVASWSPFGITYEDTQSGERYSVTIGGEWKLTLEVFRDLGIVMGIVMLLIFFVLAVRTKSLLIPALIMTSIPLGLIGILPGFAVLYAIKETYFNATSMIGVIALAGLAVKNAIIYLEYLEPLKKSGMSFAEALVEAGRIRLLPITLTSLAAILGSLTIVSDPVWEGLAWALIFGLTASTILTLLVFPLLLFRFDRESHKK